jgi:hypothetical protein
VKIKKKELINTNNKPKFSKFNNLSELK